MTDDILTTDPLVCLRDEIPEALQVVRHLAFWKPRDERTVGTSERFAYTVCADGIRYERVKEWWPRSTSPSHQPRHLIIWTALAELIGDDPRRRNVIAWADSLTAVDQWRDLYRPYELWPHPETWDPSWIASDHKRPGWDERLTAWRTVQAILSDASGARA